MFFYCKDTKLKGGDLAPIFPLEKSPFNATSPTSCKIKQGIAVQSTLESRKLGSSNLLFISPYSTQHPQSTLIVIADRILTGTLQKSPGTLQQINRNTVEKTTNVRIRINPDLLLSFPMFIVNFFPGYDYNIDNSQDQSLKNS